MRVENLDQYLVQFTAQAEANEMHVHYARKASEATGMVLDIAHRHQARLVAKSKTMVGEEIHINPALEAAGLRVVETDLGEFIVQLRGESPAHIITPAVHLSRQEVGQTFQEKLGVPYTDDISTLTATARKLLRQDFLQADIGISGVNFGVAESGAICLLTNEGNGRMVTTLPKVHIALMGIERLVPTYRDLALMLELLPRSATGQKLTVYTSLMRGPRRQGEKEGPLERHIVLVDNGRTALRDSALREILYIFVDHNCVKNAVLESGKTYHIGKIALRLIEKEDSTRSQHFLETAEILPTAFDDLALLAEKERATPWSKRLLRDIEMVPFLAPISKAELSKLANAATLHIFEEGQTIFSEGDPGRSIYAVVQGRVRIFIRDHCGRALDLATLEVGDFWGAISFLSGRPRSANATTLVSSLLIEVGYVGLKSLIQEQPGVKKILLEYYRNRLAGNKKRFTEVKFEERRGDPRLRDTLPVRLALIAESRGGGNRPNSWETSSLDISVEARTRSPEGSGPSPR